MNHAAEFHGDAANVFWAELSPCEHVVQIYEEDGVFLDSLQAFVAEGLRAKEAVIIIATPQHLNALNQRLWTHQFDLIANARSRNEYITLDAAETLSKFMVNGMPDERLFADQINGVLARARVNGRRVRAFGEMVAILWAQGLSGATVRLEHLWSNICRKESLPLFCAYPKSGFTQDAQESMREICAAHTQSHCC